MITVIEDNANDCYAIPWEAASNTELFRADLASIPGWRRNQEMRRWEIPKRRALETRALYIRHNSEPAGEPSPDLWEHQAQAVRFGLEHPSALFDMWMGTGKTRTGVELIGLKGARNTLIIGPLSSLGVWRDQLEMFARYDYKLLLLNNASTIKLRANLLEEFLNRDAEHRVVLINREAVWRSPIDQVIERTPWDVWIIDEVHAIKSAGGRLSRFVGKLAPRIPYRYGLSGTPLPHSILDAYGIYRFLQPSIFGTNYAKFEAQYADVDRIVRRVVGFRNVEQFRSKYDLIRFHAGKDALQLDEPIHNTLPVRLPQKLWQLYRELEQEFIVELRDADGVIDAPNVLVKYLRLQQIESGFATLDDGRVVRLVGASLRTPKEEIFMSFLEDFPEDEKLVVFTRFQKEVGQAAQACFDAGRKSYEYTGANKEFEAWRDSKAKGAVLIANLATGSEAIDCTAAGFAVFWSLSYKLSEYEQAVARIARPGQKQAPRIYVMVPEGPEGQRSIGRRVYEGHLARRSLLDMLVEGE